MNLTLKVRRAAVVSLHLEGKTSKQISNLLKKQKVNRKFIYRTVKRYKETKSIEDRKRSGRPVTVCTKRMVNIVRLRIRRNPRQSMRNLAKKLNVKKTSLHRLMKNKLGLKAYKLRRRQGLTKKTIVKRLERCKALLSRFDDKHCRKIFFTDEKLFRIKSTFNNQNDRVWSKSISSIPKNILIIPKFQNTINLMVWGGISSMGKTKLIFVEEGVKINARVYKYKILMKAIPKIKENIFKNDDYWIWQQDSAPAHKAKTTQKYLESHTPDFIGTNQWPPSSPDLSPLDYSIWSIMLTKLQDYVVKNRESMKEALVDIWDKISLETCDKVCMSFRKRLRKCVDAKGGHFE
jgi:inhibitor of nuclear factor kappa-B kinase subunit alpha